MESEGTHLTAQRLTFDLVKFSKKKFIRLSSSVQGAARWWVAFLKTIRAHVGVSEGRAADEL